MIFSRSVVASLFAIGLITVSATAKAPALTSLFPGGAALNVTVEINAAGTFDNWPVGIWISGTGVSATPLKEKGKIRVVVTADATPGTRWLRVFDREGATGLRPFIVGTLPEVSEIEPNDELKKSQVITKLPVLVNGRLGKRGDADSFVVKLSKGQTLVADVEANRSLGSPMDSVLQVANSKGIVLDQNDDNAGRDPRVTFVAPGDGSYLVRLFAFPTTPDSTIEFAGGDAFVYRLTLTTGGFLDYAFPLTVGRDCSCKVEAIGTNITDQTRSIALAEPERDDQTIIIFHKLLAGISQSRRVAISAAEEAEPNDRMHPQTVPFPVSLSGRVASPGDRDTYRVHLNKGANVNMRVESHAFGLPLDATLHVIDPAGKTLLDLDDSAQERDPRGMFSAAVEGDYLVEVRDLFDRGGVRFAYLLTLEPPTPEFTLSVAADRFDVKSGESINITVTVDRKDGDTRVIQIGGESLPAGVECKTVVSKPGGDSAKIVKLEMKVEDCTCPGAFRIVGKAESPNSRPQPALAAISGFLMKTDTLWLSINAAPQPDPKENPKQKK